MLGTIANSSAIIAGSLVGLLLRRGIPQKYSTTIMHGINLAVIMIGLKGALKSDEFLLIILSLALGSMIGEFLRVEVRLENLGKWLDARYSKSGEEISKGFVKASLIFCIGSMAIVGSLEGGLTGNHQVLFAKSVLDGVASIIFACSFGIGVLFSSLSVLVYQGLITLGASFLKTFLTTPVISQMSAVGGLLITATGLNMLEVTKIRVGNMLPSIFLPLIYFIVKQLLL